MYCIILKDCHAPAGLAMTVLLVARLRTYNGGVVFETGDFCNRTKVSETRGRAKWDAAEDGQDDTPQAACNAFMMTAPL